MPGRRFSAAALGGGIPGSALILDAEERVCLVSLDVLNPVLPMTRSAAWADRLGHGHPRKTTSRSAPRTPIGASSWARPWASGAEFVRQFGRGKCSGHRKAFAAIDAAKPDGQATVQFGQSQEATVDEQPPAAQGWLYRLGWLRGAGRGPAHGSTTPTCTSWPCGVRTAGLAAGVQPFGAQHRSYPSRLSGHPASTAWRR